MNYRNKITKACPAPSALSGEADLIDITEHNRDLIIQSAAIRRLQQKTQVYPLETNAAVRSRLTHSLEVQQTGRTLARTILKKLAARGELDALNLVGLETPFINLVEMACLMHDVGNPPMGHFGEACISQWLAENALDCYRKALDGRRNPTPLFRAQLLPDLCTFEGNAQGLRIISTLQELNLSYSQLASLIKYTRSPVVQRPDKGSPYYYRHKKPGFYYSERALIDEVNEALGIGEGCRFPLVYIMEASDDIAYCIADLEDAVDKGILSLPTLVFHLKEIWQELDTRGSDYLPQMIDEAAGYDEGLISHMRFRLVKDLIQYAADRYIQNHQSVFDGTLDEPLIDGGSDQDLALQALKTMAIRHVFNSREKETPELRGYSALMGLLTFYRPLLELPGKHFKAIVDQDDDGSFIHQRLYHRLPHKYKAVYRRVNQQHNPAHSQEEQDDLEWYYRARLIIDYISGMTDHFAVAEYQHLSAI